MRRPRRQLGCGVSTTLLRTVLALVLATALATTVTACSPVGERGPPSSREEPASPGGASEPPTLETRATIGNVEGRLDTERRDKVKTAVTEVVDAWLDAAYVAGGFPRTDFDDAYPGFSSGARNQARSDSALMSNEENGDRVESVVATKRRLRIDVLAVRTKAVGVTARFVLTMDLTGEIERSERVAGSLFMTWRRGGWQVFGYDVKRGLA